MLAGDPMRLPPSGLHGGDGGRVARALGLDPTTVLDLSMSLNPLAPDPEPVLARHLGAVHTYPETDGATGALARAMGIDPARLLLTNGGAEAIALVAGEVGGRVVEPDFGLYPRRGGALWRSNPHSPSGLLAAADAKADVWDEAFYPLATGRWTRGDREAIAVGSLTKLLACPGLRIGYVLGEPEFVARCRERQPAWAVNGVAAAALPALLESVDLPGWSLGVARLRVALTDLLAGHGFSVRPSDANWVLVDGCLRDVLAPHGVVVRDCASFGLPGVTRVAVPSESGLARLDAALRAAQEGHRSAPASKAIAHPVRGTRPVHPEPAV
jgi:histidinol-phosphate/aromatic aminotransferase/cobyric acid decarboxylase-like protein